MTQNGIRTSASGGPFDVNGDGTITGTEATVSLNRGAVDARADLKADNFAWSIGANYLIGDNFSVFGRASSGASFNVDRALDFGVRDASGGLWPGLKAPMSTPSSSMKLASRLRIWHWAAASSIFTGHFPVKNRGIQHHHHASVRADPQI